LGSTSATVVAPLADDENLKRAVQQGHRWWVLKETIPPEAAAMISDYRNSDNNTNQVHRCHGHMRISESLHARRVDSPLAFGFYSIVASGAARDRDNPGHPEDL